VNTPTPGEAFKAMTKKVDSVMTPQTKIAIPLILVCSIAWWALDTVRQRDLDKIEANAIAMRRDIAEALESAKANAARYEDMSIRVNSSEINARYTAGSLQEMKGDIKGILVEVQQMRREVKQ